MPFGCIAQLPVPREKALGRNIRGHCGRVVARGNDPGRLGSLSG